MADKNLDGNGLSEVWVRAAQLVKKYTGAVDSTKGDLQTQVNEKLSGTDDTKDNTVTFTSADESNPTVWKDVATLDSKEKHSSLFAKISTMFSNVRYLYKLLGTTDISALGSVTEAIATISGNVGNMKGISSSAAITTEGEYALDAREKNASVEGTLANQIDVLNSNLNSFLNRNSKNNLYNPTNTGYSTLRDFLTNEIFVKSDASFCVFAAGDFSDLPSIRWSFTIIAYNTGGAVHVYAYKFLSNNEIYVRGMGVSGNWIDDWKQISFV